MKNCILILALALPLVSIAQDKTEGKVFYNEKIKFTIQLPDNAPEEMKKMVPPEQVHEQVLNFSEKAALYRDSKPDDQQGVDLKHEDEDGNNMEIKIMRPQNVLYRDLDNDKIVESREFMGRTFLIKDDFPTYKWKLNGDKKVILGYNCQKATLQDTSKNVVAWFAPELNIDGGPLNYGSLPGLILELDQDNGSRTYTATKVAFEKLGKDDLAAPTKGKTCTSAEFKKTVEDKMKEMNAEGGGPGIKMIIREERN